MYQKFIKRLIDILLSILMIPFVLLVILILAIFIKLEDRGPVFYISDRLKKDGELFKLYKIRSMKVNAPDITNEDGSTYNSAYDSRITRIGHVVRKTSLDELPQILNVLKGDMSFIGPRPDLPRALNIYSDFEKQKLKVQPGITGYNQAFFRNSISQHEKFKNDVYYVDNISFSLDIKIFMQTLKTVLLRSNINTNGE